MAVSASVMQQLHRINRQKTDLKGQLDRGPKTILAAQRKLQAARLNTTLNALRLRASRLRRELGKCTDGCLARSGDK